MDNASLQELFSKFGEVLSCKVAKNEDGTTRGYGFVQFASQESADAAIENLHGTLLDDRKLYGYHFVIVCIICFSMCFTYVCFPFFQACCYFCQEK